MAERLGIIDTQLCKLLLTTVAISMAATPALSTFSAWVADQVRRVWVIECHASNIPWPREIIPWSECLDFQAATKPPLAGISVHLWGLQLVCYTSCHDEYVVAVRWVLQLQFRSKRLFVQWVSRGLREPRKEASTSLLAPLHSCRCDHGSSATARISAARPLACRGRMLASFRRASSV